MEIIVTCGVKNKICGTWLSVRWSLKCNNILIMFSTKFVCGHNSQARSIGGAYRVCPLWCNILRFWWIRHPRGTVIGCGRCGDKIIWVDSLGGWDGIHSCYWVSCGKERLWCTVHWLIYDKKFNFVKAKWLLSSFKKLRPSYICLPE